MEINFKTLKKFALPSLLLIGAGALLASCRTVRVPEYAEVLEDFDVKKYSGKWYEIARFDFKHEKNLNNVTAEYTLNDDGSIRVVNRGYNFKKEKWEEAIGKALPVGDPSRSALKVSFFGPFYAGYNVVMMDPDYENALVFGESRDYIWILSRQKSLTPAVKKKFLQKAADAGYNLERLVWTEHDGESEDNETVDNKEAEVKEAED